jgi:hypothetical protein
MRRRGGGQNLWHEIRRRWLGADARTASASRPVRPDRLPAAMLDAEVQAGRGGNGTAAGV